MRRDLTTAEYMKWLDRRIADLEGRLAGPRSKALAYFERTSSFNNIGPASASFGVALTDVDIPANRRIRVTGFALMQMDVSAARASLRILQDTVQVSVGEAYFSVIDANGRQGILAQAVVTPSAGEHDYALTAGRTGTDTLDIIATSTAPAFLMVEDIGPAL